jgi:hypothetical protein
VKLLSDLKEIRQLVYNNRVVVIAYLGNNERLNNYVIRVLRELEDVSKSLITYGSYKVGEELDDTVVVVYVDGKEVLEQRTYFMKLELDVVALKMGIRDVMSSLGLKTPF